ncbi:MAG: hypothetical protein V3S24_13065, partial [Candidatus Tectomicrobia bacterium]
GELDTARELSEQLLDLARERHDPRLRMLATVIHGITLYHQGVFAQARESLEQVLDLYDPQRDRSRRVLQDPKATTLAHLALTLWVLGYPEQALQKDQEALTLVRELAHPNTLAATLWYSGRLHMLMRDTPTVHERAEAAVTLSTEHGLALMLVMATLNLGWALVMQDRDSEGIAQLQQGIESLQAQGHRNSQPMTLTFLAEAYGHTGQFDNALDTMSEAFAVMAEIGGRQDEAEMYRLKGELIENADCGLRIAEWTPEACFQKALEVARHQQAKSLELRAAMSLSRLWQHQAKRQDAYDLLAPVYGWFTEGFDTADLQEAKSLLEELEP